MDNKPYRLGLLVGRFQTLHKGHEDMIDTACVLCDRVVIMVGSAQEENTNKNPFSYEMRKEILHTAFGDKIEVYPMVDIGVGNVAKWGEYVIKCVVDSCGEMPDLLVSGKEERRIDWFDGVNIKISELYIPKTIDISATQMREFFINDDFESFKEYTNANLWDMYDKMRKIVLSSKDNLDTDSV
ncbi:MAG: adenylyltransferase/cytidyltransferase family protein [Eubacterium sp.]|nr:adenylyltransferase/cytidyltransferase family protein [Eubacterium sp.]